jgi:hypothetical protein
MVVVLTRREIDQFEQRNFRGVAEELFPLIRGIAAEFSASHFSRTQVRPWFEKSSAKLAKPLKERIPLRFFHEVFAIRVEEGLDGQDSSVTFREPSHRLVDRDGKLNMRNATEIPVIRCLPRPSPV